MFRQSEKQNRPSGIGATLGLSSNRAKVEKCELCGQVFSLMHKQHECKRCLRAICWDCGKEKTIIPQYDPKVPHRTCKDCREDQSQQSTLRDRDQCRFGNLSKVGKRWLSLIKGDNVSQKQIQDEYQEQMNKLSKQSIEEIKSLLQQYLLRLYKEIKFVMNYSLFDWHYQCTLKENDNSVFAAISNVLTVFYQTQPIKLTKNLVLLTLYLLYFCDEAIAHQIILHLHTQIIPMRLQYHKIDPEEKKAIDGEVDFLVQIYKDDNTLDSKTNSIVRKFFEEYSTPMISSMMVNSLGFYASYYLMDYLFVNKEFHCYEKMLAYVCKLEFNQIRELGVQSDQLKDHIVKVIQLPQLQQFFLKEDQTRTIHIRASIGSRQEIVAPKPQPVQTLDEDDKYGSIIESLLEIISDKHSEKAETVLNFIKSENVKVQYNQLTYMIRDKREKFDKQKKELSIIKANYEQQLVQVQEAKLLENQIQQEQDEQQRQIQYQDKQQLLQEIQQDIQQESIKSKESKQSHHSPADQSRSESRNDMNNEQLTEMSQELHKLRQENHELQNALQQQVARQSVIEQFTKEKQQSEQEQQIIKLNKEKQAILNKVKSLQTELGNSKSDMSNKQTEITELQQELQELKNSSVKLNDFMLQQNQLIETLNKQIDSLKLQVDGYKRKKQDQQEEIPQINKLEDSIQQLRNSIINKERELYLAKFQFVGINQQRLKIQERIAVLESENKHLKNQLSAMELNYQNSDAKKLTEYYESKIDLLQQTHQEQMNRLFQQSQQPTNNIAEVKSDDKVKPDGEECVIF